MGRGFNSAENELQFCFEKGLIFGTIGPRSGHDRAAIGPRSRRDRAVILVLVDRQSLSGRLEAIPPLKECNRRSIAMRSWCDHGSIAPQSQRSSRKLLRRPMVIVTMKIRRPRDGDRTHQRTPRVSRIAIDRDRPMTIG